MEEIKLIALDFSALSEEIIEVLLLDSSAEPSLFEEIAQKNTHRPEILRHILNHPRTPPTIRQFAAQTLHTPIPEIKTPKATEIPAEKTTGEHPAAENLLQKIQKMRVGEKIQLALRGGRDIRTILVRDTSKEVMLTVLENPKITESEIEIMAKQKTTREEILRAITKKREWLKNYSIVHALVTNPKTPSAMSTKYMFTLKVKDLLLIEKNKNLPEAVRATAKKLIATKKP